MATFKAEVQNKRADGTYNVRIRVTHNRTIRRLSTSIFVTDDDLTRTSLKIKNVKVLGQCEDMIKQCRDLCASLGLSINNLSTDELAARLKAHLEGGERFKLDFILYTREKAKSMSKGTGGLYLNTANALQRLLKRDSLDISEINGAFLESFESFLIQEPSQRGNNRNTGTSTEGKGGRAVSLYLGCVRAMHNAAKKQYNDEDRGVIRIPYSPFKNFRIKAQPKTRKRALSVDQIQKIINLPYNDNARRNLAKDCFIISLALIGMNSADMYTANKAKNGTVIYNRLKTASRRYDSAEMRVRVEPVLDVLLEKY